MNKVSPLFLVQIPEAQAENGSETGCLHLLLVQSQWSSGAQRRTVTQKAEECGAAALLPARPQALTRALNCITHFAPHIGALSPPETPPQGIFQKPVL